VIPRAREWFAGRQRTFGVLKKMKALFRDDCAEEI
jgi:hypothetical protein